MSKQPVLYGIIGVLVGGIIAWVAVTSAVNGSNFSMMRMMGVRTDVGEQRTDDMSMSQMTADLRNKTGDDFDKAFLREMTTHHQGAIDMAYLAKTYAKHDEIKTMASDIIAAQTKEISQMKMWQDQWGYQTNSDNMRGHSMMSN